MFNDVARSLCQSKNLLIALFLFSIFSTQTVECCAQQLRLPIVATVAKDSATVLSGPGRTYYATNEIPRGATVDVFELDPGGWCAIRPLEDSFSLVRSSVIEIDEDNNGVVVVDRARAWVGTNNGPVDEPFWQVRLRKNEPVQILGEVTSESHVDDVVSWIQISPPNGEFRWIHIEKLDLNSQRILRQINHQNELAENEQNSVTNIADTKSVMAANLEISPRDSTPPNRDFATDPDFETDPLLQLVNSESTPIGSSVVSPIETVIESEIVVDEDDFPTVQDSRSLQDDDNEGWRPAKIPMRDFVDKTGTGQPNDRYGFADTTQFTDANFESHISRGVPLRDHRSFNTAPSPSWHSASPNVLLDAPLQQLELELTNQLLDEPYKWQLDSLEQKVRATKTTLSDNNQLQMADNLLAKIIRFRAIKNGYANRAGTTSSHGRSGSSSVRTSNIEVKGLQQIASNSSPDLDNTYDAYGVLNELVRDGGIGQTTFVLQDSNGKITHHVRAAPGLNLHRYLKMRVGVIGQKGFNQKLKLDHVTAERIIDLNRHLR